MSTPPQALILGGTGFIGSALKDALLARGYHVHILARHALPDPHPAVSTHRASLDDVALIARLAPDCQLLIHAASTTTPGTSAQQPSMEASHNILPTLRLFEALSHAAHLHCLFISSGGTVYGNPRCAPVCEDYPGTPTSYYGAGKRALEGFWQAWAHQSGACLTILRPANVYGPTQAFRPGFGLIRTLIEHLNTRTTLQVWGDGHSVRDYLYIDDLVQATLALIGLRQPGCFNLGAGVGHSVRDVVRLVERSAGMSVDVQYRPARSLDVDQIVLDIHSIQSLLPHWPGTALAEGIRRTWAALGHPGPTP